jgi:hypothetical protein
MAISAPSSSKEIFYSPDLVEIAKPFKLSTHDELEITCINRAYLTEATSMLKFSAAITRGSTRVPTKLCWKPPSLSAQFGTIRASKWPVSKKSPITTAR